MLQVNQVKELCKSCGVQQTGSKHDMVLRIRENLSNNSVFNKVFSSVWGASGRVQPYVSTKNHK